MLIAGPQTRTKKTQSFSAEFELKLEFKKSMIKFEFIN